MKHSLIGAAALLTLLLGACSQGTGPCEEGTWLEVRPDPVLLQVGGRVTLDATLHDCPTSIEDPPVTLSVRDPSIATVDGRTVTGVAPGTTTVTATTPSNGPFRSVTVTVSAAPALAAR